MRYLKAFTILFFLFVVDSYGQTVIINEVSTNNFSTLPDNDGDFPDWIELYNTTAAPINLLNYKLSDDAANLNKWTFPSVTIPANGYLTVYASDKNRFDFVDHWESLVLENNSWKYTVPTGNIAGWMNTGFSDAAWSTGNGGIGYGDADDGTTVPNPTTTVYARRTFNLVDATAIQSMILYMDYDDGFVAFLNGVEIARANIVETPANYNSLADNDREAVMYSGGNPTAFAIPKTIFQPLLVTGNNVLAIEIHNKSATSTDMTMRPFLMAGISNATVNYQALPGWFTPPAMSNNIHTNFKLSASGETVYLSNASGTVINTLASPAMQPNDAFGRFPNGSTTNRVLQPATPNASNGTASAFTGYWNDVLTMNPPAGYYAGTQSVTLTAAGGAATTIRYTTDGTKPTAASPVYSGAINVTATTVVRAAAFHTAGTAAVSKYETNTYFISDNTTIPVISISTAPANFFSSASGIYVEGPNAGTCPQPYRCYNYWQDWEREIHVEYFDKTKVFQFEQDAGVKILGGWSRANAMKSMQIRSGDEYNNGDFDYKFFTEVKKSNIDQVETFTLRNGGNDFNYTMLRDAVNHRVLNSLQPCVDSYLDFEGYEPVLVYINGQYWGLHTLRERVDNSYFDNNAGYGKGEYNLGETSSDGRLIEKKGSITDFNNLLSFVSGNTMNTANYTTVKGLLDIENFVDYFSAEFFHTNWDWPHNNVKFWKPKTGGKWRYIYHDTDFGYGIFNGVYATPTTNEYNRIMVSELTRSEHAPLFTKLMTNTEFKNYFINRSADLLNTIYNTPYLKNFYDALEGQLTPEMPRHFGKWPQNSGSMTGWTNERNYVKNFMDNRVPALRNQITSTLGAGAQVTVTLNTSPAGAGKIKINTVTPCSLPWSGVYFNGVPVTIEVIPNDGYTFSYWQSSGSSIPSPNSNKKVTLTINSTDNITAYFNTTTNIPKLTITELNYHSDTVSGGADDAGDWIELYNAGNATLDLSGWALKDDKPFHRFTIPNGTTLAPGQYLVLVSDVTKFQAVHPTVTNFIGPVVFDFSNGGETLDIVDPGNTPRVSITYDDVSPWPTLADGLGTTMERVMTATNLNDPATWFDGCRLGSPGRAYTPCPCLDVELGPTAILCTSGGSKTLTTGLSAPHTNRKFYWYKDGVALATPLTQSTLTVASAGVYKVLVDSMGCYKTDIVNVVADLTFDLGPAVSLCSPVTVTLDSRLPATGVTYVWTRNSVTISGATGPSLLVTSAGTYVLTASATGCTSRNDNVVVTSVAATPTDASRCMPGSVTLGISGSGTYQWYANPTGGSSLGSGTSFVTPSLTNTTTYYVQDMSFYAGTVGPADTTFGNQSQWVDDNMDTYRLRFDVMKACVLNYITVYTEGPQTVVITVYASNGTTVLHTRSVPVTSAGAQRIPLGFNLAVGNDYYIGANGTTGNLYYNHDNASYPYTEPGAYIRIDDTDPTWVETNGWYPYLYKWEFSNGPGPCDRVPVTAYNTCPVPVTLLSLGAARQESGTVLVSWKTASEINSYRFVIEGASDGIHFDSIGSVAAMGNSSSVTHYSFEDKTVSSFGCYYRLRQIDLDQKFEYSPIVKISNDLEGGLYVSPNPSENNFNLFATSALGEKMTVAISDLSGRILFTTDKYFTNQVATFGEELSAGTYLLQVTIGEKLNTAKIVKF